MSGVPSNFGINSLNENGRTGGMCNSTLNDAIWGHGREWKYT